MSPAAVREGIDTWLSAFGLHWPRAVVEGIVSRAGVRRPADLYRLSAANLVGPGVDERAAGKAWSALHRPQELRLWIKALGMPRGMQFLAPKLELEGLHDLERLLAAGPEELATIRGVDAAEAEQLVQHLRERREDLEALIALGVVPAPPPPRVEPELARRLAGGAAPLAPARVASLGSRAAELRERYGFELPDDFFALWEFVNHLDPAEPARALREPLGIDLVGPYDALAGSLGAARLPLCVHWRSYMDPPELFTVLSGFSDGEHAGYWLDDPSTRPGWVASYFSSDGLPLGVDGRTVFDAVRESIELSYRDAFDYLTSDAEHADDYRARIATLDALREKLLEYGTADRSETGEAYLDACKHPFSLLRRDAVVASTVDGMGIAVPPRTYRRTRVSGEGLRDLLCNSDGAAVIAEARAALEAGLPGTTLELAKGLWVIGKRFRPVAVELSAAAYRALDRPLLAVVAETHHATWRDGSITFADRKGG